MAQKKKKEEMFLMAVIDDEDTLIFKGEGTLDFALDQIHVDRDAYDDPKITYTVFKAIARVKPHLSFEIEKLE